jgi:hypothetical protein
MVDEQERGPGSGGVPDGVHHGVFAPEGERHSNEDDAGARALRDEIEHIAAGVVLVVGDEEFVAGLEWERAQDGVHAGRGVGDERETVGVGRDECRDPVPSFIEEGAVLPYEEVDGFGFEPGSQF